MKRITLFILILLITSFSFFVSPFLLAKEGTNKQSAQFETPSNEVLSAIRQKADLEFSAEQKRNLKEKIKSDVTEKLRRLYDYMPGTLVLEFKDKTIPDKMALGKDGKIKTGSVSLDQLLTEYGFNQFDIIGTKQQRTEITSGLHNFAYCHSPILKNQTNAFLRNTYRGLGNFMQDFEVELYKGQEKCYPSIVALNLNRAMAYLENEKFKFNFTLWGHPITFMFKDRPIDPFSQEIIKKLKSNPLIVGAYIDPKCYLASESSSGQGVLSFQLDEGEVPDYYANNSIWYLNYSPNENQPPASQYPDEPSYFNYSYNPVPDEHINAKEMWDSEYDASNGGISAQTNRPVVIAVIDSGIDFFNPEFSGRIFGNEGEDLRPKGIVYYSKADIGGDFDGIDNDRNSYIDDVTGFNFFGVTINSETGAVQNTTYSFSGGIPSSAPYDDNGHGTSVSGIIAAANDNSGLRGIAYNSLILPLKVLNNNCRFLDSRDVANAIYYVIYMKTRRNVNIVAVNCSVIAYFYDSSVSTAVVTATNAGITMVFCSGNEGWSINPAQNFWLNSEASDAAIMVGSSNRYGQVSEFSNYGYGIVDVVAPGEDMFVLLPSTKVPEGLQLNYGLGSWGTSYSAPQVTAMAALLKANYPQMAPAQIQQRIKETSMPLSTVNAGGGLTPISAALQGYGLINLSGIANSYPQAPSITSTPPTQVNSGEVYTYQAQASGVIHPWFEWAEGFTPPQGMQLDPGIGLITWPTPIIYQITTPYGQQYGNPLVVDVQLVAKNSASQEYQQNFSITVNPIVLPPNPGPEYFLFTNATRPLIANEPYQEDAYYPTEESYDMYVTIPAPFAQLPTSSWTTNPQGGGTFNFVHYSDATFADGPWHGEGVLVNDLPLKGDSDPNIVNLFGWPFIPGSYPIIGEWLTNVYDPDTHSYPGYTGPTWWDGYWLWPDVNLFENNQQWSNWSDMFDPFYSCEHKLLFYNSPGLQTLYNPFPQQPPYWWDLKCYRIYGGSVIIHNHEALQGPCNSTSPETHQVINLEANEIVDLPDIYWEDPFISGQMQTMQPQGTIYYTDLKTGEEKPLRNVLLAFSNLFTPLGNPNAELWTTTWTDESGYFKCPVPIGYTDDFPPYLIIEARCRDADIDTGQAAVAEIRDKGWYGWGPNIAHCGEFPITGASIKITLMPSSNISDYTDNVFANALMNMRQAYDFLKDQNLSGGTELVSPVRPKVICYYTTLSPDVYYDANLDEISIGENSVKPEDGPGWYEIINNYALAFLQWQFEQRGIETIDCSGGEQSFTGPVGLAEEALKWGFADLVALRTFGEEQQYITYQNVGEYDIENTDFEATDTGDPALLEGVVAGIFLDMVDVAYDPQDETLGSMSGDTNFYYIFYNLINTANASIAQPGNYNFNILDFYRCWNGEEYPDTDSLYGIYLGHGITDIEEPGITIQPWQGP